MQTLTSGSVPTSRAISANSSCQEDNGDILLGEEGSGTPQRFLWLPATDPDFVDLNLSDPPLLDWDVTEWAPDYAVTVAERAEFSNGDADPVTGADTFEFGSVVPRDLVWLPRCDKASAAVRAGREASAQGRPREYAHSLLQRLKVAAALALLNQHIGIRDSDWDLAAYVMDVSDRTRDKLIAASRARHSQVNKARGRDDAERAVVSKEYVEQADVKRVKATILRKIMAEIMSHSDLRRAVQAKDRDFFNQAVEDLAAEGRITVLQGEYHGKEGTFYELAAG